MNLAGHTVYLLFLFGFAWGALKSYRERENWDTILFLMICCWPINRLAKAVYSSLSVQNQLANTLFEYFFFTTLCLSGIAIILFLFQSITQSGKGKEAWEGD